MKVIAGVNRGTDVAAFKALELPRPITGDLVNDEDLIWRVTEVRLMTGKEHLGAQFEPVSDGAKNALADPSGAMLKRAGWDVHHPRAHQN